MAMLGSAGSTSFGSGGMRGWKRPRSWPGRVLAAAACLLVAIPLGVRSWLSPAGDQMSSPYRYRFERPAPGMVTRALQEEIAFYQMRVRRDPTGGLDLAALSGVYLRMARATGDLQWFLLAEQAARRSLSARPSQNTGALLSLARVAEARHDFAEAVRLARLAGTTPEALSVLVTSYLAQGRIDLAAQAAQALVGRWPGLGSYALRGLVASARGEDEGAIADFNRAIASEESGETGSSAWVRTLLGRLHYRRGRHTEAAALYREALRILPQYPLALVNLAELEMRQGRYRSAEQHLTRVVNLTRESPNVYDHAVLRGLARLHELRGHDARAAALWDEAERRLRRDVTTGQFGHRRELARLLLERGRAEDAGEAVALMEADVRIRRDAETLEIYAWALARSGRWDAAQRGIQEALHGGSREARLFYRAATIAQGLGDPAGAKRFLARMRETDPTFDERARQILGVER